ncbi:MAG: ABC transporter ATP-binding protein [Ignavibacteria bacterium]|jgi:phospholipid/cholesterol/gamma-HCH transport system ATP-binding protein
MIQLHNVSLTLGKLKVLDNVSLSLEKGKVGAILGPSGAGKSTILKLILGLWHPDEGCVTVDGIDICQLPENDLLPIRRKMGMIFQGNALFDSLNVRENVGYFLYEEKKYSEKEIAGKVAEVLAFLNLSGTEHMYPDELSGGMKKRVAIGRALVFNPEIILYDEPTAGLDPINSKSILDLIKRVQKKNKATSIVVTHIMNDAVELGNQITLIHQGKIIENGTVHDILNSDEPFVKDFFYEIFRDAEILKKEHLI